MFLVMGQVIILMVLFYKCLCSECMCILEGLSPPTASSESPDKGVQAMALLKFTRCTPACKYILDASIKVNKETHTLRVSMASVFTGRLNQVCGWLEPVK